MVVYHCAKKPIFLYENFRSRLDKEIALSLDNLISISNATLKTICDNTKILKYLNSEKSKIIYCGIKIENNKILKLISLGILNLKIEINRYSWQNTKV